MPPGLEQVWIAKGTCTIKAPEIKEIDARLLTGLVRESLHHEKAEITHWDYDPLSYINTETSNLGLYRFRGTASVEEEDRPWSIVLKAVHAPVRNENPTYWNYHRREILAYQTGLLADLPAGLSEPTCLAIDEYADDVCWLWLEDIVDTAGTSWSLREYGLAARHLGQFNGAYVTGRPMPSFPWLSQNWIQGWLAEYTRDCQDVVKLVSAKRFWDHPLLRSAFPRPIADDVLRLWDSHQVLLAALDRLPATFCHMDAYRPNLFIRRNQQGDAQTVAIDWAFAGPGALGEEIANLLAASLMWYEYDASRARELDEAVFSGYLAGLHEAGWQGDARLVRFGYASACALRWGIVGLWWLLSMHNDQKEAEFEVHWKHPLPELVAQWAQTAYYVLDLAQEAYQLQQALL